MRASLGSSKEWRFWYFAILSGLGSLLLGSMVGASWQALGWLILSRPLVALVLTLLPRTTMGDYRPYLGAAAFTALLVSLVGDVTGQSFFILALALYLVIDVACEALVVERSPRYEWLGQWAQLLSFRAGGLYLGLFLATLLANTSASFIHLVQGQLVVLCLTTFLVKEAPLNRDIHLGLQDDRIPRLALVIDSLRSWVAGPSIRSTIGLFWLATLSGLVGSQLLPIANLDQTSLSQVLSEPGHWLMVYASIMVLSLCLETLRFESVLLFLNSLFIIVIVLTLMDLPPSAGNLLVDVASGLVLLGSLTSALSVQEAVDPRLRTSVLCVVWVAGLWLGESVKAQTSPRTLFILILLGLLGTLLIMGSLFYRLRTFTQVKQTHVLDDEQERRARGQGLHGDKKLDFTAVPMEAPTKRRHLVARIWHFFTIRLPVSVMLALLIGLTLAAVWQTSVQKQKFRGQAEDTWKQLETSIFLSSLGRRVTEEMLASNRVPRNWPEFISANFQLDGRPMKDRDFWDTPLQFQVTPKEIRLISAGPDKKHGTSDDIRRDVSRPDGVQ